MDSINSYICTHVIGEENYQQGLLHRDLSFLFQKMKKAEPNDWADIGSKITSGKWEEADPHLLHKVEQACFSALFLRAITQGIHREEIYCWMEIPLKSQIERDWKIYFDYFEIRQTRLLEDHIAPFLQEKDPHFDTEALIKGACYGLHLLHAYYFFLGQPNEFFLELLQLRNDIESEGIINDILALQGREGVFPQANLVQVLQALSDRSEMQALTSPMEAVVHFPYSDEENGYPEMVHFFSEALDADQREPKYLSITTGNHALGIAVDQKGYVHYYDPNVRSRQAHFPQFGRFLCELLVKKLPGNAWGKPLTFSVTAIATGGNTAQLEELHTKYFNQPSQYVDPISYNGFLPLDLAWRSQYIPQITLDLPNQSKETLESLLEKALFSPHTPIALIEQLLKLGADPNCKIQFPEENIPPGLNRPSSECGLELGSVNEAPLFSFAAPQLSPERVSLLLEYGADPTLPTLFGRLPVYRAIANKRPDVAALLLDPASINQETVGGENVLIAAARRGYIDLMEACITRGADPNYVQKYGTTPLLTAIETHSVTTVSYLLERGAFPNQVEGSFSSPIATAAKENQFEMITLLVEKGANVQGADGFQALFKAVASNRQELIDLLLEKGAPIEDLTAPHRPLLPLAIQSQVSLPLIEKLIAKKADCNALYTYPQLADEKDLQKEISPLLLTPLLTALLLNRLDVVPILLASGANPNEVEGSSLSPIALAADLHLIDAIPQLVAGKAKLNGKEGLTLLFDAIHSRSEEVAWCLLRNGAPVFDPWSAFKQPLLHFAICSDASLPLIELIVERGADCNALDKQGRSPLQLAQMQGREDLVHMFLLLSSPRVF